MEQYSYDLHIHSCLSPCGDDDMTPANIAGLASLLGLKIVALTDHNSVKNCPAFFAQAKRFGIVPVAGMELTTAEEVHIICLFEELASAMDFGAEVEKRRVPVKNRPQIFGNQFIMDENDEVCGEEENLLINAASIDISETYSLCTGFGGICYPAHIDRESGGLVAVLGTFPELPPFTAFELNDGANYDEYLRRFPELSKKRYVVSSDAHRLPSMSKGENKVLLDSVPDGNRSYSACVRHMLFRYLKGD